MTVSRAMRNYYHKLYKTAASTEASREHREADLRQLVQELKQLRSSGKANSSDFKGKELSLRKLLPDFYSSFIKATRSNKRIKQSDFVDAADKFLASRDVAGSADVFLSSIYPLWLDYYAAGKSGDAVAAAEYRKAINAAASGRGAAGLPVAPAEKFVVKEFVPLSTDGKPTESFFNELKIQDEGSPISRHIVNDRILPIVATGADSAVLASSNFYNELAPKFTVKYGEEPFPVLRPWPEVIEYTPIHVQNIKNRYVPMAINKSLDVAPVVVENVLNKSKKAATNAASRVLKRTGYTVGGMVTGAGLGLALSKGLFDEGYGYDIPAALIGASIGGLSGYALSNENALNTLKDLYNKYGKTAETAGSGLGLSLAYRALAKKPNIAGTLVAGGVGAILPSAIRAILSNSKNSDKNI